MFGVFACFDSQSRIIKITSDAYPMDTSEWVKIDEGDGDRYQHAQGNYLPMPLMDERGRYRYKLVDGVAVERTAEDLEEVPLPAAPPTVADQLRADIDYLAMIMEVNL